MEISEEDFDILIQIANRAGLGGRAINYIMYEPPKDATHISGTHYVDYKTERLATDD